MEFSSVGQFYKKFEQVSDEEVKEILEKFSQYCAERFPEKEWKSE